MFCRFFFFACVMWASVAVPACASALPKWQQIGTPTQSALRGVFFWDDKTGFIVGDSGTILKTSNGAVWEKIESKTFSRLSGIYFLNPDTGWICGAAGTILATTDGGDSWNLHNANTTANLVAIHFENGLNGLARSSLGLEITTTNGGISWQHFRVLRPNQNYRQPATGIPLSKKGEHRHSEKSGASPHYFSIHYVSPHLAFAVGDRGSVWKYQENHVPNPVSAASQLFRDGALMYTLAKPSKNGPVRVLDLNGRRVSNVIGNKRHNEDRYVSPLGSKN